MIPVGTYRDRPVAVFGLGGSGIAAARALMAGGAQVSAWDDNAEARDRAAAQGVLLKEMGDLDWSRQAALVLAPGVPLTHPAPHPVVVMAHAAQCPIIGDIELFAAVRRELPPHAVVAITGTNGKSTTTALIAHLINACGGEAAACGNIGAAILDLDPLPRNGVYVVEISSFQIDLTHTLGPQVAVLLNITPDHLDRHGTMENYVAVKRRLFDWQGPTDMAIVGIDDDYGAESVELVRDLGHPVVPVSVARKPAGGVYVEDGLLWDPVVSQEVPICDLRGITTLRGAHNCQNAAAAYAAVQELGYEVEEIAAAMASFPGLPHRLEQIAVIDGVAFINDSKATNIEASVRALASLERIHWIAGGQPKDDNLEALAPVRDHLARAYLIGEAADDFEPAFSCLGIEAQVLGTMERAVAAAASQAQPGDVVLLSPACASFDQYPNFAARGDHFRAVVADLKADNPDAEKVCA